MNVANILALLKEACVGKYNNDTVDLPSATVNIGETGGTITLTGTLTPDDVKAVVVEKAANYTCLTTDSGKTFIATAADVVFTLPSTASGLQYTFVCAAVSASTGLSVSPAAADNINEGTDDKDLINSGATDVLGDSVTVVADGTLGWYTTSKIGTWAAES
jgi:hypothetical protein